jgi:hypothetical protein
MNFRHRISCDHARGDANADTRPVRLAYQPPASCTFLSEQISHQPAVLFSQNKSAPAINHQANEQVDWFYTQQY